jgi:hypothetical protein
MAREEVDREDLLRDARTFVERISIKLPGRDAPILAGFHRSGGVSLYFGTDPVFHFNSRAELRRQQKGARLRLARNSPSVAVNAALRT